MADPAALRRRSSADQAWLLRAARGRLVVADFGSRGFCCFVKAATARTSTVAFVRDAQRPPNLRPRSRSLSQGAVRRSETQQPVRHRRTGRSLVAPRSRRLRCPQDEGFCARATGRRLAFDGRLLFENPAAAFSLVSSHRISSRGMTSEAMWRYVDSAVGRPGRRRRVVYVLLPM